MGKSSRRQRSQADTADEQRLIKSAFAKVKADAKRFYGIDEGNPVEFAQVLYCLLLTLAANHEENMRKAGIPIPKLVEYSVKEHIGRNGGEVERAYVHCNRCEFCEKDAKTGDYCCGRTKEVITTKNGDVYDLNYVTNYDGCSKGILRKEYR